MPRYKLTLEYDGTGLVGWQRQKTGVSVQAILENAVERLCGARITVHGAGRTDAGVHALAQAAHLDLPKSYPARTIRDALNQHVKPHRVAVLAAEEVLPSFDARRSARGRVYRYRILNRRPPPTVDAFRVWHVGRALDANAMQAAANLLLGQHDFSTFRDSLCQARSPVKTLDALEVTRQAEEIVVEARARSFLHHQVRNMVGTLKLVGDGSWGPEDVAAALAARARSKGGPTAPAEGLYLVEVVYPAP
jgi:tRNA pseudouridine38-40 synthase